MGKILDAHHIQYQKGVNWYEPALRDLPTDQSILFDVSDERESTNHSPSLRFFEADQYDESGKPIRWEETEKQLHVLSSALQEMLCVLPDRIHLEVFAGGDVSYPEDFDHYYVKPSEMKDILLQKIIKCGIAEGEYHFIFR